MRFIPILLFIIIPPLIAADIYVRFRPYDTTEHSNSAAAHTHLTSTYHPQRSYTHTPNLRKYSAAQLKDYFTSHRYYEQDILSQYDLYLSDEFIVLAKTYEGYEQAITSLHKKFTKMGNFGKWMHSWTGFYSTQLAQRIKELYNEIHCSIPIGCNTTKPISSNIDTQLPTYDCEEPISQIHIIDALEHSYSFLQVADNMDHIVQTAFKSIEQHAFVDSYVEDAIYTSVEILKDTNNPNECIFHVTFIDQALGNLENRASTQPSLIQRSPELLARAITTFIKRLNPVTQIKNSCEFLISTAHFVADVTIGKLYLSEEQYSERINSFWSTCNSLSPSNLAQLEAEQWVDLAAQLAADCVFFGGVGRTVAYLKEIGAVSQAQKQAIHIAQKLKNAIDGSLAENPLVVTAEGLALRATDEMKLFGGAAKEIIQDSRALLESLHQGLLCQYSTENKPPKNAF